MDIPEYAFAPDSGELDTVLSDGVLARADRLTRRLAVLYAAAAGVCLTFLGTIWWPFAAAPRIPALAREAVLGGLGAMVLPALLLSLTGLAGTLLLTGARRRTLLCRIDDEEPRGPGTPGFAARIGQGVAIPLGAGLIGLAAWLLWSDAATAVAGDADLLAAFVFGLAFLSLVAERVLNAVTVPQLPEAPALRRLLLLTTIVLAVAGVFEVLRGAGLVWARWIAVVVSSLVCFVAAELALRAAARLFLPAPPNERAIAVADSIVAGLLTGGPRAPGTLIRTHLGVDFARSWAIGFIGRAILPAAALTALLSWGLSGLKLIDLDARGIYERLGAPVAVLGPGLHLLLPWPLGRLRPVELGSIHAIAIGSDAPPEAGDQIAAEAIPPPSADRLWETAHATEVNYLVASQSGAVESFQLVSTEILVLYRTGLTDADATAAVYGAADPEMVVRQAGARLATRFFGDRTLDAVMGDQPQTLSDTLRRDLAADVAAAHAGIEILAVVIEEIHPPAGAAAAYHRVQAAEIDANASISDEIGRATRMRGVAAQEAHQLRDAAEARAAEMLTEAQATAYQFGADRLAYQAAPAPFLLERSFADLGTALAQTPLTLIDYRLPAGQGPLLDLRRQSLPAADVTAVPPAASLPSASIVRNADTTPPTPDAPADARPD